MKKAFSMIELIFVIVILGILAAVAVPKLAQEKAKGTAFEKIAKVGSEIRKEIEAQNKPKSKTFTEDEMKTAVSQKEMWKQKFLEQELKYNMCTNAKTQEVAEPEVDKSFDIDPYATQGTGY